MNPAAQATSRRMEASGQSRGRDEPGRPCVAGDQK
jgi:hypothetical protein